jgi:putative nucleotidyltransferase with HDIG domain
VVTLAGAASLLLPRTWTEDVAVWLPALLIVTVLSTTLEFITVPMPRGGVLSIATMSHVATILLIPAPWCALSVGVSVLIVEVAQRDRPSKVCFNVGSYLLTASLAAMLLGLLGNPWHVLRTIVESPTQLGSEAQLLPLAMLVAVGVPYYVINLALSSLILSVASGYPFAFLFRSNSRNTLLSELGAEIIGGLFAVIWIVEPLWTSLLAVPGAVIGRSLRYIRQLETETSSAVRALARLIDHRDPSTYHHSERVAEFAMALARELGLDEDLVALIEEASAVHDLGKIGVPDAILLKPGPLMDEEREAIELHTEIGSQILEQFHLFRRGSEIVLHHHERWDGGGYPSGLQGLAIPLGARVVAVADAFDAMTADRPYRMALPVEEALARLRDGAGTQWDPDIVPAFVRVVSDGRVQPVPASALPLGDDGVWRHEHASKSKVEAVDGNA